MLDLSSYINFIKPQINLNLNDIDISINNKNQDEIYKKIAKSYDVNIEQIEFFSGIDSAIYSLFNHLDLKHCVLYAPIELHYKKACVNFAYELRTINRFENIHLPIKEGALVVFSNPSSIDGTLYDIKALLDYWMKKSCTILIDESFIEFTESNSATKYLADYDKLYILKDVSFYYGFDGLKISSLISNSKNIEMIQRFEPQNKISSFDLIYLNEILDDKNFKTISKAVNIKSKIELEKFFQELDIVENLYHSSTNFLLVKLKDINFWDIQKVFDKYKIKVKECTSYDFLDSSYIRVSLCSQKDLELLKKAFRSVDK